MKYNNKYAIALVLLASSAFGASSVPVPDYDVLTAAVNNALDGKDKFEEIDATKKTTLEVHLSKEQLAAFEIRKGDELNDAEIKKILKEVYDGQVTAYNAELEAKASAIITLANSDWISKKPVSEYGSDLTLEQYDSIAEYEYKAEEALTKDVLVDFLKNSTLPTVTASNASSASRIIKLAGNGKISEIANEKLRKIDLDDDKFEIIKQFEAALGNTLSKDQLEQFLTNNNFHHLDVDVRVKAILTLANTRMVSKLDDATLKVYANDKQIKAIKFNDTKVDEALLAQILKANDTDLDEMMKSVAIAVDPNPSNGTPASAANPSNGTPAVDPNPSIVNPAPAANLSSVTPAVDPNPSNGTADLIAKIKAALVDVKDFSKLSDDAIKVFGLSDKQVEELKKANVTNATADAEIEKILSGKVNAIPIEAKNGANKPTDDPIAKIKAALASVDDFSKLTSEAIKALGLTDKQVEALKKANVTKDTTDEDIKKALNAEAEATTSSGSGTVTNSNTENNDKNAEVPFYKNAWIMVPSGVILLSAIGGGVFMMTRKTEDTDL